tara:strand:+ start:593 stop:904 length:312 start_codon:yes stop_codon:yes gene_type:complete
LVFKVDSVQLLLKASKVSKDHKVYKDQMEQVLQEFKAQAEYKVSKDQMAASVDMDLKVRKVYKVTWVYKVKTDLAYKVFKVELVHKVLKVMLVERVVQVLKVL